MAIRMLWVGLVAVGIALQVCSAKDQGEGRINLTANIVADSCELDDGEDGNLFVSLNDVSNKDIEKATGAGYEFKNIDKSIIFNCSATRAKLTSMPLSKACQTGNGIYSCGLLNPTVGVMPVLSVGNNNEMNLTGEVVTGIVDVVGGKATLSVKRVYAAKLSDNTPVSPGDVSVEYQLTVWNF